MPLENTLRRALGFVPAPRAIDSEDRGRIVYHPRYEGFLKRAELTCAGAVLDLRGEIVCGHPDRHVARVVLGEGSSQRVAYLKREHLVGVRTQLRNRAAGFGWVSRSEREAITLQRLEAAGLPGPQWLAYGTDGAGRAFLLVDELTGMKDLRDVLGDAVLSPADRRRLAGRLGRAIAELHAAGFSTPELAAKHLFLNPATVEMSLVDWQSAGPPGPVPNAVRAGQLAGLNASLAAGLATPRERLRFARAYLGAFNTAPRFAPFVRMVAERSVRLGRRSSTREQQLPPAPRLVWLAGERVCVIPEMVDLWPEPAECAPFYLSDSEVKPSVADEWITFAGGRRALLTRFSTVDPAGRLTAAVRERPWRSPAAVAARMLFHLRRYGIPAPNLLAFGQRLCSPVRADSFILSEPVPAAVPLAVRLAQLQGGRLARWNLLHRCGETIRRLHDAGCRTVSTSEIVLAASATGLVAVANPSCVRLVRRLTDRDRASDIRHLLCAELPSLSRADRCRVVQGYMAAEWTDLTARRELLRRVL